MDYEENEERLDIYSDKEVADLIENDELSSSESGFMTGYNSA